jgi:hypothetical protein
MERVGRGLMGRERVVGAWMKRCGTCDIVIDTGLVAVDTAVVFLVFPNAAR